MKCCSWYEYQEEEVWADILNKFNCVIVGSHFEIDERCSFLGRKFKQYGKIIHQFKAVYPSSSSSDIAPRFHLNDKEICVDVLNKFIKDIKKSDLSILLDISTFDLPELYHFLSPCNELLSTSSLAYTEPKEYTKEELKHSEYSLSKDGNGIDYLSSCDILPFWNKKYLISIGYESHRLAGFLSSDEIQTDDKKAVIIGIPPFNVGWEHHAIKNNYQILDKHKVGVHIAPADDPIQTYLKSCEVHRTLNRSQKLVLMPIGPKPQALGMIWFALSRNTESVAEVGIQYDFVRKVPKRTTGISKIHFWNFTFD